MWQKLVDVNRVTKAFHKLKEINWLYKDVDDDSVDESAKKVFEVCDSATGKVIEKVTPQDVARFQAYTIWQLDQKISPKCDIDHYKLLNVDEDAIDSRQEHLDVMCFPVLFPEGKFGQYYRREVKILAAKSRSLNKDTRFEKTSSMSFIFCGNKSLDNCLLAFTICWKAADTVEEWRLTDSSIPIFMLVRGTKQYWFLRNSELKCMVREWGTPTLFLTFSCAEYESPEIIGYLKKVNNVPDNYPSGRLCTEDPMSVSRKFSQKFHS